MERPAAEIMLRSMMNRYRDLVFSICLKITGDWFAAEDLTQETFLSAWKNLDAFDGKNEKAWLARIAANRAVDYNRAAARRAVPTEDEELEAVTEESNTGPEELFDTRQILSRVAETCSKMTGALGDTAEAHFIKGKSASEIAREDGIPLKTVQSRIRRSREILKTILGKEGYGP